MENNNALRNNPVSESEKTGRRKRFVMIAVFLVVIVGIICGATWSVKERTRNKKQAMKKWELSAITFPEEGSLQPAGYITIHWNPAEEFTGVKGYKVYVGDDLIAETDAKTTSCEYYTTQVSSYTLYVEADMKDGSTVCSNPLTFYVNKKGFCLNKDMAQTVEAPDWGVSWYYNWSVEAFKYTSFQSLQFVPMMWTSSDTDDKTINRFPKFGYKYVLAFNEPDRVDQADIEVDDAVKGMKAFMDKDLIVGSPATAICPPWSKDWFQPFMTELNAQNMDVDFIAVHHYWNWYNDEGVQAFLDLLDETYEMYHKPIWITEFAISGDPGRNEKQLEAVEGYMKGVIPELDKREYVERYAWFSFNPHDIRNGASALLQTYTGEITELGKLYQELGMPEGYKNEE